MTKITIIGQLKKGFKEKGTSSVEMVKLLLATGTTIEEIKETAEVLDLEENYEDGYIDLLRVHMIHTGDASVFSDLLKSIYEQISLKVKYSEMILFQENFVKIIQDLFLDVCVKEFTIENNNLFKLSVNAFDVEIVNNRVKSGDFDLSRYLPDTKLKDRKTPMLKTCLNLVEVQRNPEDKSVIVSTPYQKPEFIQWSKK